MATRTSLRAQSQAHIPSQPIAPSASKLTSFLSSSISSHLAMVELKQRILTTLSKLPDRDTHQIVVDHMDKIIQALPSTPREGGRVGAVVGSKGSGDEAELGHELGEMELGGGDEVASAKKLLLLLPTGGGRCVGRVSSEDYRKF